VGYRLSSRHSGISRVLEALFHNKLVVTFVSLHLLFAVFLGRLFALAPDEGGYLYTFNNIYGSKDHNPQFSSGWLAAPKPFLWIAYLPAKILNIFGMPDYLSVRMLSIAFATLSLVLLLNLQRRAGKSTDRREKMIFLFFFIPSIFLWTTVGLREVFILAELSLIFVGLNCLFQHRTRRAFSFISLGSYALLSTKNYIWICLILSSIVLILILAFRGVVLRKLMYLAIALLLIPGIAFASTSSHDSVRSVAASLFHSDLTATGTRSGDSITQIVIPEGQAKGPSKGNNATVISFHGDSTLILLHFYLVDHPQAIFSRVARSLGIAAKIQEIWDQKIKSGLVKKTVKALPDSSSLNGHILKPGKLHNPASIVIPALRFMFGPVPFLIHGGIALNAVAFESPLWWLLYSIVLFRLIRYRKNRYWQDPLFLLSATYFLSLVAISALVEVNLGTSFRHRSILFIPLLVMYLRSRRTLDAVVD
jgi:hypothetical protein